MQQQNRDGVSHDMTAVLRDTTQTYFLRHLVETKEVNKLNTT